MTTAAAETTTTTTITINITGRLFQRKRAAPWPKLMCVIGNSAVGVPMAESLECMHATLAANAGGALGGDGGECGVEEGGMGESELLIGFG